MRPTRRPYEATAAAHAGRPPLSTIARVATLTDEELVRRVGYGDRAALAELYARHAGVILAMAGRVLDDRAEAEDVVHDVFVAAYRQAQAYSADRGSAAAWLVTLGESFSVDRSRRLRLRRDLPRRLALAGPVCSPSSPESAAGVRQVRALVHRAVSALSRLQRETLVAAFYQGRAYSDIAAAEGVPVATIKSRIARAIASLKCVLLRDGLSREDAENDAGAAASDGPASESRTVIPTAPISAARLVQRR